MWAKTPPVKFTWPSTTTTVPASLKRVKRHRSKSVSHSQSKISSFKNKTDSWWICSKELRVSHRLQQFLENKNHGPVCFCHYRSTTNYSPCHHWSNLPLAITQFYFVNHQSHSLTSNCTSGMFWQSQNYIQRSTKLNAKQPSILRKHMLIPSTISISSKEILSLFIILQLRKHLTEKYNHNI